MNNQSNYSATEFCGNFCLFFFPQVASKLLRASPAVLNMVHVAFLSRDYNLLVWGHQTSGPFYLIWRPVIQWAVLPLCSWKYYYCIHSKTSLLPWSRKGYTCNLPARICHLFQPRVIIFNERTSSCSLNSVTRSLDWNVLYAVMPTFCNILIASVSCGISAGKFVVRCLSSEKDCEMISVGGSGVSLHVSNFVWT